MDQQLNKMVRMLKVWLEKNSLDTDIVFYTIDEWRKREESFHNDAQFIITTEGGLNFMLNYGDGAEFYDLIDSFGYYIEMGYSWSLGFYKDEFARSNRANISYSEKLQDKRWQDKRKYILEKANYKCEDCSSTINLEIHHCYYLYNFEPWEYPYDSLRCLCKDCHKKRGNIEQVLRGHLASLKTNGLEAIIELISNGLYWYPKEEMFSLLRSFNYDQDETKRMFSKLKRNEHEDDPQFLDEDVEAVRGMFITIANSIKNSSGKWQGLILDHADDTIYGGLEGVHEVDVWRDGNKLIPEAWYS